MSTHHADRSSYETFNACPRKSYWGKYYDGIGLVPTSSKFDLEFGKAIHAHLEHTLPDYDALGATLVGQTTPDGQTSYDEALGLHYGLTRTYTTFVEPRLLDEYEFIGHEVEMTMNLGHGIDWLSRLDGVLRRKSDGLYFVLEAKTTGYPDQLMKQSRTNFQLLMECEALRQWLPAGSEVGGALLLVFNKGKRLEATKKEQEAGKTGYRRVSPFTYAYRRTLTKWLPGDDSEFEYSLDYKQGKGWERVPTWVIPGWYDYALGEWPEVIKSQVQVWPSVAFDEVMVESVLRQVTSREGLLKMFREKVKPESPDFWSGVDYFFGQNFSNCNSDGGYGKQCPFFDCCYSPNVARDPVASGLYEKRVPNHRAEREAFGGE